MNWPPNLFTKALPDRSATDAPRQPEILYLSSGIGVALIQWSDYIAAEKALTHPIVFRALNKLANSVQQVRWKVQVDTDAPDADQRGKEKIMADIQALMDCPNDHMTPSQFRYWLTLNYACYGKISYKVGYSAVAPIRANGLYPLEARHVRVIPNQRGTIDTYKYGHGESEQTFPSKNSRSLDTQSFVDQIWKPALRGYQHKDEHNSPLRAVGLPAQVVRSLLLRAIQTAEGHPNVRYMVTCSKNLTEPQKAALKQHLNQDHGPQGADAGKVPILQNVSDLVIHTLDNDLSDIHSKMPSDDMARLIFGSFGIPIALAGMGAADGAKFAGNYVESRLSFWEDTVIPDYVNPIFQGLTKTLCPAGVKIAPDYDSVPAMVAGRMLSMKTASEVNFLTNTEKRELFGLKPNSAIPDVLPTSGATTNGGQPNADK